MLGLNSNFVEPSVVIVSRNNGPSKISHIIKETEKVTCRPKEPPMVFCLQVRMPLNKTHINV